MARASEYKFGAPLGFAKAYHTITSRRKCGRGPGLGELPKIWGFPFNIYTMAELTTLNLIHCLGLPRSIITPHPEEKWAWPWAREALRYLGFPFNICAVAELFYCSTAY